MRSEEVSKAILYAKYSYESDLSPQEAASRLAEEQSTGKHSSGFYVSNPVPDGAPGRFSGFYSGYKGQGVFVLEASQDSITLGYSKSLASSVPSLLVLLQGEALELGAFSKLVLTDIELAGDTTTPGFSGPHFGVKGLRDLLEVYDRPLVAAILKPSVGLDPEEAARLADAYVRGGADIVKDDELASSPYKELAARCREVSSAIRKRAAARGRPAFYALNITGPTDELVERARLCNAFDNVWPMVCEYAIGLDALRTLREHTTRPILCHRAGIGAALRCQHFGMTSRVQAMLSRLCGADLVHCGSFRGKLFDDDESVREAISATSKPVTQPNSKGGVLPSMPLVGGGFSASQARAACEELKTKDLCFVFGASVAFADTGPEAAVGEIVRTLEFEQEGCQ